MSSVVERIKGVITYHELKAIKLVTAELNGQTQGIMIMAKIADAAGITRSVVVNAFKLLEVAGVVETKSLGMKGTFIKILDKDVVEQIIA